MNFTRKRALLACDFCRHRKRRCDGKQPCSTCRDAHADCVYKELPTDRVEPSASSQGALVERLSRIEALLEEQGQRLSEALKSPSGSTSASFPSFRSSPLVAAASPAVSARSLEGADAGLEAQFLIPPAHTATLSWLLSLPAVGSVIGEFPRSYFCDLEQITALPQPLDLIQPVLVDWPPLEPDRLRGLADAYFNEVSANLPLLTRQTYESLQDELLRNGPSQDVETAVCLCVWALGSLASHSSKAAVPESLVDPAQDLGLQFFSIALRIIVSKTVWAFTPSLQTCQALVLAGTYFCYLGRPLHSYRMVHYAGQIFLEITNLRSQSGDVEYYDEDHIRVFWCCFVMECDRAAEFDIARTGIEPLGDKMRLPRSVEIREAEDLIYFAAEMAIRRLMNRIIGSLYSPENIDITLLAESAPTTNNTSLNQLLALSSELNRQLDQYCATIPIQPPIVADPISNDRRRWLNLRSLCARQLIHRPFVLYVALQPTYATSQGLQTTSSRSPTPQLPPPYPVPRVMLERCHVCIQSCEAYILSAIDVLDRRTPYVWTVSQSCMMAFVVLFLASRSAHLGHLAPDLEVLAGAFASKIRKWATRGSSFEALLSILEMLLEGRRR